LNFASIEAAFTLSCSWQLVAKLRRRLLNLHRVIRCVGVVALRAILLDGLVLELHLGHLRLHFDMAGEAEISPGCDEQLRVLR
jgi:hypothetical protein